jgi:hypothetical protein
MEVTVAKIILNDGVPVATFMEMEVSFYDESQEPHQGIVVRVYVDKKPNVTLDEIRALAIQKAYDFLSLAIAGRQ